MKSVIGNPLEEVKQGIILQQVNAQGVMGSGFAKAIRDKWPVVWDVYSQHVTPGTYAHTITSMGRVIPVEVEPGLFVVNIVTQHFYGKSTRRYTSYDALDNALEEVYRWNTDDLAVHHPLLGCGLGGASWNVVKEIMANRLGPNTTLWTLP